MNISKKIALIDMDGTTFDYEGQLRIDLEKLRSPSEPSFLDETVNLWDESNEHIKARMDLIKSIPGWWENLPKFQVGWDVVEVAKSLDYRLVILTKGPNSRSRAWAEKVECVQKHFGTDVPINLVGSGPEEDKDNSKANIWGRVLVDDYPAYMKGWLSNRKRGLGIMPAHFYNKDFWDPQVIRCDGTNMQEVARLMKIVAERAEGEDWLKQAGRDHINDFESWEKANKYGCG